MIYDDIITQISGFATQSSPLFYPSKVLETYHLPNEVWIRTSQDDGTEEIFPFSVSLFYQSQGFLLIYRTVDAWSEDNVIHGCVAVQEPEFVIWDPEEHLSYFELLARTTYKNDQDDIYAQPLESATRLTVEMFYEQFSDPNMPLCLETPSNLWPGGW